MKNNLLLFILAIIMLSCKSKQGIATSSAKDVAEAKILINSHQALNNDFNTLSINASTSYKDKKNNQSFTTDIRIEKDKQILVSVRILGLNMAKAHITPNEVKYYEKINNTYFEGDYSQLSQWLGTPLDFEKIQNLLLGKAIHNLTEKKYISGNKDGLYTLSTEDNLLKEFYAFDPVRFLLKTQIIDQKSEKRRLTSTYQSHQEVQNLLLPIKFTLNATQETDNNNVNINMEYKSIKINESLTFPYSVPSGYTQTQIN